MTTCRTLRVFLVNTNPGELRQGPAEQKTHLGTDNTVSFRFLEIFQTFKIFSGHEVDVSLFVSTSSLNLNKKRVWSLDVRWDLLGTQKSLGKLH